MIGPKPGIHLGQSMGCLSTWSLPGHSLLQLTSHSITAIKMNIYWAFFFFFFIYQQKQLCISHQSSHSILMSMSYIGDWYYSHLNGWENRGLERLCSCLNEMQRPVSGMSGFQSQVLASRTHGFNDVVPLHGEAFLSPKKSWPLPMCSSCLYTSLSHNAYLSLLLLSVV